MEYNKKANDEVINLFQKFMHDSYKLRVKQNRQRQKLYLKTIANNEKHTDRNTNNPDKAS